MQQVIEFESSAKQQPIDVRATIQRRMKSVNGWLNSASRFYTHICGFSVTRLLAIRVNLVFSCIAIAAVTVEQQPAVTVPSALCAAWLVYRINKSENNQQSLTDQGRKGGKK